MQFITLFAKEGCQIGMLACIHKPELQLFVAYKTDMMCVYVCVCVCTHMCVCVCVCVCV